MPDDKTLALEVRPGASDVELIMSRSFDAPRHLVFDAFTKPEHLERWFGPPGWSLSVCEVDLRPGGAWRYVMTNDDGREMAMQGEYREVVRPERFVTTEMFDEAEVGWRKEDATVNTNVFDERDGRTTLTISVLYRSREVRDAVIEFGAATAGAEESYKRLDGLLRSLRQSGNGE